MKKSVLIYGLSTALNRGGALLYLPFLTTYLSLPEYGIYSLAQVLVQLVWPLVILNGSVAVQREGPNNFDLGFGLLNQFLKLSLFFGPLLIIGTYFIFESWVYLALAIAWMEGLHQLVLSWLRVKDKERHYLVISFLRSFGLFFVFYWASRQPNILESMLVGQVIYYFLLFLIFYMSFVFWPQRTKPLFLSVAPVISYCLYLIPHMGAQWIMSSSDRFIIKHMMSEEALGIYSVGYTVSMCLMLINSGVAIAIPQFVIKNYEQWLSSSFRRKCFWGYLLAALFVQVSMMVVLELDHRFFHILPTDQSYFPLLVSLVSLGLYCLGHYYIFANYIFYKRDTKSISKYTIVAAIFNVIFTVLFVPLWGVLGAAFGTFLTYILYLILITRSAQRIESRLSLNLWQEGKVILIGMALFSLLGVVQWHYW